MTSVACIGIATHDIIFPVDELPSGPGKVHTRERYEVGGGTAANAAVAVAALGGDARLVGALGDDALGDAIVGELDGYGVDTSRVRRLEGLRSPLSAIAVDRHGERLILNHGDAELFARAEPPSVVDLDDADAVLADVRWVDGATAALDWARKAGRPGVVDYDMGYPEATSLLTTASHVIFSSSALRRLTGETDLRRGLEHIRASTGAWLAVTDGPNGTHWLGGDEAGTAPAPAVDVVDTTGAGDVYHGVFTFEMGRGVSETSSMRVATHAAALSCTRLGGREGAPSREELERFLGAGL